MIPLKSVAVVVAILCVSGSTCTDAAETTVVVRGGMYWGQVVMEEAAKVMTRRERENRVNLRINVDRWAKHSVRTPASSSWICPQTGYRVYKRDA